MLLDVLVPIGVAGLLVGLMEGPVRRLGLWIAGVTLSAFPLIFLIGPVTQFVAVAGLGVVIAACAPFTARRNRLRWQRVVTLTETGLLAAAVAWDPAMAALSVMILAPGVIVACYRLYAVRTTRPDTSST